LNTIDGSRPSAKILFPFGTTIERSIIACFSDYFASATSRTRNKRRKWGFDGSGGGISKEYYDIK